jgi:hypothetical protein
MSPDLKRLLYALNDKYGETHTSRIHRTEYVAINKTKRKEVIWYLINTLKNRGKEQAYFESGTFQSDLSDFFFPDGSVEGFSKAKREGARSVVLRELNEVLARVFKEEDLFEEAPNFQPAAPVAAKKEPEAPRLRPDATAAPYEEDTTVLDEDFINQLKEIANE